MKKVEGCKSDDVHRGGKSNYELIDGIWNVSATYLNKQGKTKTNNKGVTVENKFELQIVRFFTWLLFFLVIALITNHLLRGLVWMPLCVLIAPSLMLVNIIEKEFK